VSYFAEAETRKTEEDAEDCPILWHISHFQGFQQVSLSQQNSTMQLIIKIMFDG